MEVQPEAADDVAAALADVAVSAPVNGTVELAGPEDHSLTPGDNPRIAPTRFADWLSQSTARQTNPKVKGSSS